MLLRPACWEPRWPHGAHCIRRVNKLICRCRSADAARVLPKAAAIDAANEAAVEAANAADAEVPADDAEALAKAADAAILEALLAPEAKGAAAKTK